MCRNSAVPRTNWMLLSDPSENSPTGPPATLAGHSSADTAARTRAKSTTDRTSHLSRNGPGIPINRLQISGDLREQPKGERRQEQRYERDFQCEAPAVQNGVVPR